MSVKIDYLILICWLIIILVIALVTTFIITEKINSCTADPIKYGIDKIKNSYVEYPIASYGSITLIFKDGSTITRDFGDLNFTSIKK